MAEAGATNVKGDLRSELLDFLGVKDTGELHTFQEQYPTFHAVDLLRALRDHLPSRGCAVELRALGGVSTRPGRMDAADATLTDILNCHRHERWGWMTDLLLPVAPGRRETFCSSVLYLITHDQLRVVVETSAAQGHAQIFGALRYGKQEIDCVRALLDDIRRWMRQNSCFRGHVVRPTAGHTRGCFDEGMGVVSNLRFVDSSNGDQVWLPPAVVQDLDRAFLDFRRHREILRARGIESRRGLLLCGEPGTGKTSTCRYLKAQLPDHTFFLVDARLYGVLGEVFKLANHLAPSVVVIEDVDLIAKSREGQNEAWVLGDLLNVLDGMEERDDVSVVVTSNSWKFLERALVDRPGRVDHVIQFGAPDDEHRLRLLQAFAKGLALPADQGGLVAKTAGLLPAQLQEVVRRAAVISLAREGEKAWSHAVTLADVDEALGSLKKRPAGLERARIAL